MALNNIISPVQQVQNSQGQPLAGGYVYLYAPGTTDFITSYTSSDLTTPNTNPVRLSGSGRANIWITRDCDLYIQDRNGNPVLQNLNANPDSLGGEQDSGLVPNGSFEIDTDGDGVPDGWLLSSDAGSTNDIDTTESTDGGQSFRFTSSGTGGGALYTEDFFPVNDVDDLRVNFDILGSVTGPENIVRVEWYDASFVSISNTDVYDSTATATSWTEQQLVASPPSGARFAKLRLIGIDPAVPFSGSTWYDRISVFYPTVVSGVFDNLTIQNNEIISTNTNGDIEWKPDGTGLVIGYYNGGADVAYRSGDPAAGGLFANNTLTGAGVERVLTTSDLSGGSSLPTASSLGSMIYATSLPDTYSATDALIFSISGLARILEMNGDTDGTTYLQFDPANGSTFRVGITEFFGSSQMNIGTTSVDAINIGGTGGLTLGNSSSSQPTRLVGNGSSDDIIMEDGAGNELTFTFVTDVWRIRAEDTGYGIDLWGRDGSGTFRPILTADMANYISLWHIDGAEVLRTDTTANGSILANTGSGFSRVLTADEKGTTAGVTHALVALNSSATLQDLDATNLTITLEPGYYRVKIVGNFTANAAGTTPGLRIRNTVASGTTSIDAGMLLTWQGGALQDAIRTSGETTVSAISLNTSGNDVFLSWEFGMRVISTAVLTPQWAQNVSDANFIQAQEYVGIYAVKSDI